MHRRVPFPWLQVMDFIQASKQASMSFAEIESIAKDCGLPASGKLSLSEEVTLMLKFFDGLGLVMYSNESALQHIVIINPVEFFDVNTKFMSCLSTLSPRKSTAASSRNSRGQEL